MVLSTQGLGIWVLCSFTPQLRSSSTVVWAGPAPGFVDCPKGKKILFGFAAQLSMDANGPPLAIKSCQNGR